MSQFDKLAFAPNIRQHLQQNWRPYFITFWIGLMILGVIGLSIWPVTADALIKYFIVVPESDKIVLQWSTENEYDLSGFEVLCKQETELDNDYHVIGNVPAQGSPQQGANYIFPILTGLEPGVSYCFALRDVTVQGKSENMFPRCGYGLGITPTPVTTTTLTNTLGLDATAVMRNANATITALYYDANATAAALSASGFFTSTPTPITGTGGITNTGGITPNLNLTGTTAITATPTPIIVVTVDFTATQQAIVNATLQAASQPPPQPGGDSPLPTPVPPVTATQTVSNTGGGVQVAALPSPLYVAVTQTPTAITTPVPPTLTLLPTTIPTQNSSALVDVLTAPNMQNLTLTLLCLTFVTTSGLGLLGLITGALYMRSRRGDAKRPRQQQ